MWLKYLVGVQIVQIQGRTLFPSGSKNGSRRLHFFCRRRFLPQRMFSVNVIENMIRLIGTSTTAEKPSSARPTLRLNNLPGHFLSANIVQLIVDLCRRNLSPVFLLVSRHMFCYFAYHDFDYLQECLSMYRPIAVTDFRNTSAFARSGCTANQLRWLLVASYNISSAEVILFL